jgi:hypothetical protein
MRARTRGRRRTSVLMGLFLGSGLGLYLYYVRSGEEVRYERIEDIQRTVALPAETFSGPAIRQPLDAAPGIPDSLPPLEESDSIVLKSLGEIVGQGAVERFLIREALLEHFVATVDNLPRAKLPAKLRPLVSVPGRTFTRQRREGIPSVLLSEVNYERYEPLVAAMRVASADRLAGLYLRYYPLLQTAYEELGYPQRDFNDRMIAVIDHLLEAPDVKGPIELVRPKVFFEFADSELEALSAGHKVLIRMGPKNAAVVKEKLRQVRERLAMDRPGVPSSRSAAENVSTSRGQSAWISSADTSARRAP